MLLKGGMQDPCIAVGSWTEAIGGFLILGLKIGLALADGIKTSVPESALWMGRQPGMNESTYSRRKQMSGKRRKGTKSGKQGKGSSRQPELKRIKVEDILDGPIQHEELPPELAGAVRETYETVGKYM